MFTQKYFANPQAWEILSEEEKQHLRCLLPPQVVLDENEAIPQEFLKYDSDWRNAIRQFKVDLQAGRYEAEWQQAAAEAMEERAAGKFDKFKEQEFEQFWGQKQKVPKNNIAGDVANVKLDDLIRDDLFKVGDVWSFAKGNRGTANREAMLIEKDVTVRVRASHIIHLTDNLDNCHPRWQTHVLDPTRPIEVPHAPSSTH